ncbi:MAG: family 43 glycosylhydrolase [Firmicutes bacterium]|nr:family 43 glycosylhydrolase [Bacillota bacterium]
MKRQICNPIFPLNEYVPDGEPHVFGDRVYLYGSHDAANSTRFCVKDYTVWSAPVNDLSNWTNHGVTYRKEQDPRSKDGKLVDFYAPDCARGNDGRYYLYYFAAGPNTKPFGPLSVAVSDRPEGPFDYYGDIRYPNGSPVLKFLTNDPAVLNDNGRIWLYYGWGLGRDFRSKLFSPLLNFVQHKLFQRPISEIKATKPSILSCAVVELENDMLTVKSEPKAVLDSKTTADKNSALYHHAFYEAASIRKFGELYYLVWSSGQNNELCYATSKYPDKDFRYRGVVISNSDLGYQGNTQPKNNAGTIHGGIEQIGGRTYVFYHRCTNNTDFSRQACAEPIKIEPDGTIRQVEVTTQGLNCTPLPGIGTYSAAICCNLITPKPIKLGVGRQQTMPRITEKNDVTLLADLTAGTKAVYKYFDLSSTKKITVSYNGDGAITVNGVPLSGRSAPVSGGANAELCIAVTSGKLDIFSFTLE